MMILTKRQSPISMILNRHLLQKIGLQILQRSGVKKERSILHWSRVSLLQMDMTSRKVSMLSLPSYLMHQQQDLITMLDMITQKIIVKDLTSITERKTEFNSTSIFSIRLRRVAFQTKHLILLSLALVLVSLSLCVMSQVVFYSKARMYYTSRLKWLRRRLLRELMLIF